ncbi:MAG: hypothetical protein HYZ25_09750 [Chloroflexi bacterium]|nr:hypothetical protein [Chloroflexota bacterium]
MHKKAKILLVFMGLSLFSSFLTISVVAAPSGPARVVNHKTKECAMIWTGDECQTCVPTGDWEILNGNCPEGYVQLNDYVPNACTYSGNPISMCDYVKEKYLAKDPNTIVFLSGLVILVLLSIILTVREKNRGVRE